jgi:hypothetical protein
VFRAGIRWSQDDAIGGDLMTAIAAISEKSQQF